LEQVREIAADVFGVGVTAESTPDSVESWDSVQHLNLVLALEEQFGVQFEPEEIERMHSIGEIAEVVAAKVNRS
jgi:acyl carrier protein